MDSSGYAYSAEPTKNPFRYLAAVWKLIRNDPATSTNEAAIVELGFARSKLGRRFARWEEMVAALQEHPETREAIAARRAFGPIVLADLEGLPEGTLGRTFADHCRTREIDPNLVHVPPTDEIGWLLNHLYQTHDIWHVVTGWGNDLEGEVGLAGFYSAQFKTPTFFGYMGALIFLNVIWRRADLDGVFAALSAGYQDGKRAQPMFGVDWDALWGVPLADVRARFGVDDERIVGEGIPLAA
jgi:ubiquinone biosynthesis protein COQ4